MKEIAIIIPTLSKDRGQSTGEMALANKGQCEATLIISHDPNRTGFTRTCNRGIRRAGPDTDICLLNDDVLWFQQGWLATLQRALYSNGKFAVIGPSGGSNTSPMRSGKLGMKGLQAVRHLPFWCVLIKRKVIDQLGLLDERFIHYASDSHYCDRIKKHGWKVMWCRDVFLKHKRHGSKLQSKWKKHDQALYRRKRKK